MSTVTESIASQIRCLSSGTMSTIIRDAWMDRMKEWYFPDGSWRSYSRAHSLCLTPKQAKDSLICDRVQFAFALFVDSWDGEFDCWQEAWDCYLSQFRKIHFTCSYMGGVDYEFEGFTDAKYGNLKRIETKRSVSAYEQSIYNGDADKFERCVARTIGCINVFCFDDYLPDRIACLFPSFNPIKFDFSRGEDYIVEHPDWPERRIGTNPVGDRCMWTDDTRFHHSVDDWDAWKQEALSLKA